MVLLKCGWDDFEIRTTRHLLTEKKVGVAAGPHFSNTRSLCGIDETVLQCGHRRVKSIQLLKVLSTYKILKAKAFNENIDETWIDWALEMIEAGYESENLYMLAGETKPYNQFSLQDLTTKVLKDLKLDYSDKDVVIKEYVYYLISNSVDRPETYYKTLRELKNICIGLDMDSQYMDFYILYFAKQDLLVDEVQWYWEGANRENIEQVISEQFKSWLIEVEQKQQGTTA